MLSSSSIERHVLSGMRLCGSRRSCTTDVSSTSESSSSQAHESAPTPLRGPPVRRSPLLSSACSTSGRPNEIRILRSVAPSRARCEGRGGPARAGAPKVSSLALELLHHVLGVTFLAYGLLVISHFVLQVFFAHRSHRVSVRSGADPGSARIPSVDVVVAAFNEAWADLEACFDSLRAQEYAGTLNVYVVDDFSPNRDELMPLYEAYGGLPNWHILLPEQNRGKRHAQDQAIRISQGEIVVTIDSDTIVAASGVRELVAAFEDPQVGAVTGDVGVTNWRTNCSHG